MIETTVGLLPEPCVGLRLNGELERLTPDQADALADELRARAALARKMAEPELMPQLRMPCDEQDELPV